MAFWRRISWRLRLFWVRFCLHFGWRRSGYYVGGPETLPPPLSSEEEMTLLLRLEAGDFSVRNTLSERNLRLVVYIARKYESTGVNIEDLVSIGSIGLIKAVNTFFNPQRNVKLATYASRCIENEMLMHLRRQARLRQEVSFDEPLNTDWDGNELLLSDVLGTEADVTSRRLEEEVDRKILRLALERLTGRERIIMELRFGLHGEEKTQKEVADLLGISQSYISRLEKRIIKRLQKEMCRLA